VTGTPAFFINGEAKQVFTLESLQEVIAPLLGEAVPEKAPPAESDAGH